jgi:hypothetical protein
MMKKPHIQKETTLFVAAVALDNPRILVCAQFRPRLNPSIDLDIASLPSSNPSILALNLASRLRNVL